jgi:hypothetical protein
MAVQIETVEGEIYYLNGSYKKLSFIESETSKDPLTYEERGNKMNQSIK